MAVFFKLIDIYFWNVFLHYPPTLYLKARINRKWNLGKQSTESILWKGALKNLLKFTRKHLCRSQNFDDDDVDDELFLWYGWPTKGVALFPAGTIFRDPHEQDSTCAEPEFRLWWMKLCSSDNHYTTTLS